MIAEAEIGGKLLAASDDGYNVIVGGNLFQNYSDHPRQLVHLRPNLSSTAAGRYQLLGRYFDAYKQSLKLHDFSPESQDRIAIQQIKEKGALQAIEDGNIRHAIDLVSKIWASLPGAGYGQHEQTFDMLLAAYKSAGGTMGA
jgi:lysozyme